MPRGLVVLVVLVALVALSVLSVVTRQTSSGTTSSLGAVSVAPVDAESSAFTCGGLSEGASSGVPGEILLSNATSTPVPVKILVFDDAGHQLHVPAVAAANATTAVPISTSLSGGTMVAADVLVEGGGVAVTERTLGSDGTSAPCAASTSSTWYLVGGTTPEFAALDYSLINPSATSAVVNVSFSVGGHLVQPQASQGLVVRPGGMVVLQTNQILPHREILAATVTATQGSVVAYATQQIPSPSGVATWLGSPGLSTTWYEARAVATPGVQSSLLVDNPTSSTQSVTIRVTVVAGSLPPFSLHVDANSITRVPLAPAAHVPITDVFATTVTASGPGVAVSQVTLAQQASTATLGMVPLVLPSATTAGKWLVPGSLDGPPIGLSLFAPQGAVTLSVWSITRHGQHALGALTNVSVGAGKVLSLAPGQLAALGRHPVVIEANGPLAIGEDLPGGAAPGTATLGAVPFTS
jgi:hypothetical protein